MFMKNKENKSVESLSKVQKLQQPMMNSSSSSLRQKTQPSFSTQAMPHKSIDLNSSKKASTQGSPYVQGQHQERGALLPNPSIQPWVDEQSSGVSAASQPDVASAGTFQKLFLEQKKRSTHASHSNSNNPYLSASGDLASTNGNSFNYENTPTSSGSKQGNGVNSKLQNMNIGSNILPASQNMQNHNSSNGNDFEHSGSKQLTSETVVDDHGASRRFSMFSKSSFATSSSFLFGTRILNKSSMAASKSTPKVNISSIFKNKAYLYLDEALISTFDDLLDKGHSIVTQRKEERDILVSMEGAMKAEAQELEKEIVPLLQRMNVCNEQIGHQTNLKTQYEREIAVLIEDLANLKAQIYSREKEVSDAHSDLTNTIKQMEIHNNEIRSDIYINKACHRQEANQQAIHKKQKQAEMEGLTKQLVELKAEYESKRLAQADRLRKMENKQKMYMGILKH